ncbi:hypothetical protein YC2023_076171 [Brassica napus]
MWEALPESLVFQAFTCEVNIITTGTATIRDCYYQSYLASGGTLWLSSSLRSQAMRNSQA